MQNIVTQNVYTPWRRHACSRISALVIDENKSQEKTEKQMRRTQQKVRGVGRSGRECRGRKAGADRNIPEKKLGAQASHSKTLPGARALIEIYLSKAAAISQHQAPLPNQNNEMTRHKKLSLRKRNQKNTTKTSQY